MTASFDQPTPSNSVLLWLSIDSIYNFRCSTAVFVLFNMQYHKTSNISRTLVGSKIVDNSDVVGASPIGAAPTTSSFST